MSNSKEIFELSNPAFLIGNGINYHSAADDMNLSWTKLLIDLFPEKYKKTVRGTRVGHGKEVYSWQLLP